MNVKSNNKRKTQSDIKKYFKKIKNTTELTESNDQIESAQIEQDQIEQDQIVYSSNNLIPTWNCTICGIDLGTHNPRQFCGKYYCKMVNSLIIPGYKKKSFKIGTWNKELGLQLYNYKNIDEKKEIVRDETKYKNFLKIIKKFDILCFQEDVIPNPNLTLGKLIKGAESISHKLEWVKSNEIYNPTGTVPTYLANSIYTSELFAGGINNLKSNTKLISFPGIETRSVVVYCTPINEKIPFSMVIANTHLSGGRYEDELVLKEILFGSYINYKYLEVKKIIELNPDIITGDFNAKFLNPDYPELINKINAHRDDILKKINNNLGELETDLKLNHTQQLQWEDWIWITRIDLLLKANGYTNAYTTNDILDTNSFLGACDVIYYKTNIFNQIGKATIINNPVVMEYNDNQYIPVLSDHFPIQVELEINKKYLDSLDSLDSLDLLKK